MCGVAAAIATTVASTALSMYGSHQQQKQQQSNAQAEATTNAQIAENERATNENLAQVEEQKGAIERNKYWREVNRKRGEMNSMFGARGFGLDSGSMIGMSEDFMADSYREGNALDHSINTNVWQHKMNADTAQNKIGMANAHYANANNTFNRDLDMSQTLLSGIGNVTSQYKPTSTPYDKRKNKLSNWSSLR